jgi:membrane protease YdiL (CAAX protease family)
MSTVSAQREWRAAHGALLLALLLVTAFLPFFAAWPFYLLVPVAAYCLIVALSPPLRRSCLWLRLGRWDRKTALAALAIVIVSSLALLGFQYLANPDLTAFAERLPLGVMGGPIATGICFSLVNALLEEIIFRGVFFDALEAQYGWLAAVFLSAAAFGLLHSHGFPPGWSGAFMAGTYGVVLGLLRKQAGGLLAPTIVHVAADATIFGIVVQQVLA